MAPMRSLTQALHHVQDATSRRMATFDLVPDGGGGFALVAGSHQAVQTAHGAVVTVSLSWEQLQRLRTLCNELLSGAGQE